MTAKEDPLKPFLMMGFVSRGLSDGQQHGDCPWCSGIDKLAIVEESSEWRCNKCLLTGNIYTYISYYYASLENTRAEEFDLLAKDRGLPAEALKADGFRYDYKRDAWVVPTMNEHGHITYLQWYDLSAKPRILLNLAKGKWLTPGLGNYRDLFYPDLKNAPVYLCESRWDRIALNLILDKEIISAIALDHPGAGAFKSAWGAAFSGRDVILAYDNDQGGRQGLKKTADALSAHAKSITYLQWGEGTKDGYDIRDYYKSGGTYNGIIKMIAPLPEDAMPASVKESLVNRMANMPPITSSSRPTLEDVREVFNKWLHMTDDLDRVMRIACAMKMCVTQDGCPPWIHIVGPPSCLTGDTMVGINRAGKSFNIRMDSLVKCHNGGRILNHHWNPAIKTQIRSAIDGFVRLVAMLIRTPTNCPSSCCT